MQSTRSCSILRDQLPLAHPDLVRFVHPDTGLGIAAALAVAVQASGRTWEQHFQRAAVMADERRLLRCLLALCGSCSLSIHERVPFLALCASRIPMTCSSTYIGPAHRHARAQQPHV